MRVGLLRFNRVRACASFGFTLIELVLVILLISLIAGVVTFNLGRFSYWSEQAFIRKLSETIVFLHHQAVADQAFYRLQFNLDGDVDNYNHSFQVGTMHAESDRDDSLKDSCTSDVGTLTCELAGFLNPGLSGDQTMIPPPGYPSLAEKVVAPAGVYFEDIRTMRGKILASDGGTPFVLFSPRGFSEFAVVHLRLSTGEPRTILINPFTGTTSIFKEYKDFEWTYGRKGSK